MSLISVYKKNKGIRSLFSEVMTVDWYEGTINGVCRLDTTEKWFICNLCCVDPDTRMRIFTLIRVADDWAEKITSQLLKFTEWNQKEYNNIQQLFRSYFSEFNGHVFLVKASYIDDEDYELVEVPLTQLRYFAAIEDVLAQDTKSKKQWLSYFPHA